ncbi:hypothetical protein [Streptomyces sp. H27-S2]|uniref:hypothetical protein n=1 Tax=Streptomyces antarcticus TaxID=2996458 RepID=UPI00227109F2|nr:hypothetical protein [Streptomyces sp. H27-S2]MCY0955286.1 hypothetical protein [Streptomyces sp. H27-S2]
MTPEQFTAIVGLGGVALGIGGTLIAARVQLKGSHAQAEATRRAAETTAVTQYAATLIQQNRAAQRAAYVGLIDAADSFMREADRAIEGRRWGAADTLQEPLDRLHRAESAVKLEGPIAVIQAASPIIEHAEMVAMYFDGSTRRYAAWRSLRATSRSGAESVAAQRALDALQALHSATRSLPAGPHLPRSLTSEAESFGQSLGERGTAWRRCYESAREQLAGLCRAGAMESWEMGELLREPWIEAADVTVEHFDDEMHTDVYDFVDCARTLLNDTRPERVVTARRA